MIDKYSLNKVEKLTSSLTPYNTQSKKISLANIIDYDAILRTNPSYVITLCVPELGSKYSLQGLIQHGSSIDVVAKSDFQDMLPSSGLIDKLNKASGVASGAVNKPQVALQSLRMSEQQFMGYSVDKFNFSMVVPILSRNQTPPNELAGILLSYAIGVRSGDTENSTIKNTDSWGSQAANEFIVKAPHSYKVEWAGSVGGHADKPHNTAYIKIGNQFLFDNMVITEAVSSFDTIFYNDGRSRKVTLKFGAKFWRNPRMSDVNAWLTSKI